MPSPNLNVHAQLTLQIDDVYAKLTADGSKITVRTDDVGALVAQATHALAAMPGPRASLRQVAGATARVLDENGLSARVVGNHGLLAELGNDCSMPGSRLLFADRHVRIGRPSALAAAGLDLARTSATIKRRAMYGLALLAATVVAQRVRRRRSGWP